MKFQEIKQSIESSKTFKSFKEKNPNAELCAGFFILDFISGNIQKSLDYLDNDKVFTFSLINNNEITLKEDKLITSSEHPKLTALKNLDNLMFDIDELKGIIGIKILDEGISSKIQKIIAVLQMYDGSLVWNLTCMLDGMQVINSILDTSSKNFLKFEKKSLMDFIKKR